MIVKMPNNSDHVLIAGMFFNFSRRSYFIHPNIMSEGDVNYQLLICLFLFPPPSKSCLKIKSNYYDFEFFNPLILLILLSIVLVITPSFVIRSISWQHEVPN